MRSLFMLKPGITYLNFGSFGACPEPVFNIYQQWQRRLEEEPVQFITVKASRYFKESREALANYIHCNANDLVLVTNPSYGINIIAKSLALQKGDEVLSTNLEYGALDKTWTYYCDKTEATYVRQPITLPVTDKKHFIEDFFKGLSNKTKAIFISHITSATALIFPVKEICDIAKEKGLLTIVDGAHVPGHIPLNLQELKADVYAGACHKWMCAPKGCSFLYVKKELQHLFDPLLISWGYNAANPSPSQFLDYHQTQGTRDLAAFMTIPKVIEFLNEHDWTNKAAACRQIAHKNYVRFCNLLHSTPVCPVTDEFLGQMCSIPLRTNEPEKLKQLLFEKYAIEVPVMVQDDHVYIRYSINVFNSQNDLDILYNALQEVIKETDLITV